MGLARDRFGTRWTVLVAFIIVALGSFGVALSKPNDRIGLSISLFAVGFGSGVQICLLPVAGLFPKFSGTIMASFSGAFQISGVVFLALCSGEISRKTSFLILMMTILCLAFFSVVLLPTGKSFVLDNDDDNDRNAVADNSNPAISTSGNVIEQVKVKSDERAVAATTGRTLIEHQKSLTVMYQMRSLEYILLSTWFSACVLPLQYYIGSIGFQLEEKGDEDGLYTSLFSIIYAASAIVAPLGGYLADKVGLAITQGLTTALVAVSFLFLTLDIPLSGQVVGLAAYGIGRLLVYGMFWANLGRRFGFQNFGTLAGFGLFISAVVSLLQFPLIALAAEGYADAVNIGTAIMYLFLSPYFIWLHRRETIIGGVEVDDDVENDVDEDVVE